MGKRDLRRIPLFSYTHRETEAHLTDIGIESILLEKVTYLRNSISHL